jgi:hypothetical protein
LSAISTYAPVGHCIYCGSDGGEQGLGDEHIVPFSLGGMLVLPKASCRACEAITSAFEGRCARIMYGSFRIREKVQTRRPKERPTTLPMGATFGDKAEVYMMPIEGVIATLPWVHFLPPGYLSEHPDKEIGWTGATLEVRTDAPRKRSLWDKSNASAFSVSQQFDLDSLARTLAKIAHALCIGEFGSSFFEPWLPPYILGTDRALSYLVGGVPGSLEPVSELHQLRYNAGQVANGEWLVSADIRLFAQGGPHTTVIVGRTTEELVRSRLAENR